MLTGRSSADRQWIMQPEGVIVPRFVTSRLCSTICIALVGAGVLYALVRTHRLTRDLEEMRSREIARHELLSEQLQGAAVERGAARSHRELIASQSRGLALELQLAQSRLTVAERRLAELEAELMFLSRTSHEDMSSRHADASDVGLPEHRDVDGDRTVGDPIATNTGLLTFENLPDWARSAFAGTEGRAAYIEAPANRWGVKRIGAAHVRLRGNAEWELLDDDQHALLTRFAELSHRLERAEEERIETLMQGGGSLRFDSEALAREFLSRIRDPSTGVTGKLLRVDPSTGESWLISADEVRFSPEVLELQEERRLIGESLLAGRSGSFGVKWVRPPG